ncbi:ABC transporter permease [Clostridium lundense]|uniref:ABC transporter permease n=1 Tax=Clostridium lundense TaxID=319475 RepID=UPI000481E016|nr:ABC transporter permease [Clostridium lundense]
MWHIVKTELWKLKRYSIIWTGIVLMLLSVLLTLFTSLANDGSVWDFRYFIEQVIKNNMTIIFPMCITLIAGYIINREQKDDTLKSILAVPISFKKLLMGKIIVVGLLSLVFGIACWIFMIISNLIVEFPGFTVSLLIQSFIQITFFNLLLYLAVLPIIIGTSHLQNGFLAGTIGAFVYGYIGMFAAGHKILLNLYPISACLGIIKYRAYDPDVTYNTPLCYLTMVLMIVISAALIWTTSNGIELKKSVKKKTKSVKKKGW